MDSTYTPIEQDLIDLWDEHVRCEFTAKDAVATMATMSKEASVTNVPVMTGGRNPEEVLNFYAHHFIPQLPADTQTTLVCRTIGQNRLIDELIFSFTHDIEMDWMLPGIAPTGRKVEIPLVVVVQSAEGKVTGERIYWDQASVLVQLGLINASQLPVAGAETARKVLNPKLPSNDLIRRAAEKIK